MDASRVGRALSLAFGDQPELPLQVLEIAEYNRERQAEINTSAAPCASRLKKPDEVDLGEAWHGLTERHRDTVMQPPKPRR